MASAVEDNTQVKVHSQQLSPELSTGRKVSYSSSQMQPKLNLMLEIVINAKKIGYTEVKEKFKKNSILEYSRFKVPFVISYSKVW